MTVIVFSLCCWRLHKITTCVETFRSLLNRLFFNSADICLLYLLTYWRYNNTKTCVLDISSCMGIAEKRQLRNLIWFNVICHTWSFCLTLIPHTNYWVLQCLPVSCVLLYNVLPYRFCVFYLRISMPLKCKHVRRTLVYGFGIAVGF